MDRKINWYCGCYDEIDLVYEKASQKECTSILLAELEALALKEAEANCVMLKADDRTINREMFLNMDERGKETVMYYLAGVGLRSFSPSMTEPKITVVFSSHIQSLLGCTLFSVLNRLEKLDGAYNDVCFSHATLELHIPGSKAGFGKYGMLIMQLYPWLSIKETPVAASAPTAKLTSDHLSPNSLRKHSISNALKKLFANFFTK